MSHAQHARTPGWRHAIALTATLWLGGAGLAACGAESAAPARLSVPDGFTIEVYAEGVVNARQMALAADGTLYVGTRSDGRVWQVRDRDGDGRAEDVRAIARSLELPSGVAWRDGDLYVGAVDRILRFTDVAGQAARSDGMLRSEVITDALPGDRHHGWKHLEFGPDGALWVPVGAPCNICDREPPYASMLRMDPASGRFEVWARGIRNTVGFDFHPDTGVLWLSDNGRDMLGDDIPPEEINAAPRPDMHFGYPHFHAGDIPDPEFGAGHSQDDYSPPALTLQAHSAPLGIAFYSGQQFPARYRHALFIAQHGSWNRSSKVGYQVLVAWPDGDGLGQAEPFVSGWLEGETNWGRPVDVLQTPDGALLISDDQGGRIYRVRHNPGLAGR